MKLTNKFYIDKLSEAGKDLQVIGNYVVVDYKFWKYLAKASGLKSKKQRHIMKRAKKVFKYLLSKAAELELEKQNG